MEYVLLLNKILGTIMRYLPLANKILSGYYSEGSSPCQQNSLDAVVSYNSAVVNTHLPLLWSLVQFLSQPHVGSLSSGAH